MKYNLARTVCFSLFISFFLINGCVEPVNKKKVVSEKSDFFKLFKKKNKGLGKISSGLSWDYEYTGDGLPSKITGPGGKATEFSYEFYFQNSNRLRQIEKKTGDGSVNYLFGETGNLTTMTDKLGQVKYEYDESNRLIKVSRANIPSVSYTYNSTDQITSQVLSNGYRTDYIYDFLGRLSVMKSPAGEFTYNYFMGDGIVERNFPNGIRSQYKFSPEGNLESIIYADKADKVIVKYSYSYNPDRLINSINEWTPRGERKLSYDYDQVQRLTGFVDADGKKTSYSYDEFGNRTEVTENNSKTESYTYDGLGRMLTFNDLKCEYDNSGNLLTGNDGEKSFEYNSGNQLKKAGNISYVYDGDGSLIGRVRENQNTTFLNNPLTDIWQPVLALRDDGKEAFYIWEGNTPVAKIENGETTYFMTDHLSSVRGIVNENGNILKQINFSPFGIPDQTSTFNNFDPGFSGLFYESDARLYLTKARAYSPNTGRFLQIDPLHQTPSGSQKNISLFAYCGGDPINFFDRNGQAPDPFQQLHSDGFIWWTNYLNDIGGHLLDARRAKESLATYSDSHLRNARGTGIAAGVTATMLDIVGGYIPGGGGNRGQDLASVAWSLTLGGFNRPGYFTKAFKSIDIIRTFSSAGINYLQENYVDAAFDVLSLHGTFLDKGAENIINGGGSYLGRGNQFEFYFANPDLSSKVSKTLLETSNKIGHIGRIKDAYSVWDVTSTDITGRSIADNISNVGGIYLAGAGKTFEGLGSLSGIAIDESNGKLVLISEDKGGINLPPFRMDDVVTVFRSVYQHGEAPFVSIDPNPKDPHGPVMNTRHGAATDSTYVGWVLFEADRIMKAYSLGEDNITKKPVESNVPGYNQVLDIQFSADAGGNNWERFWIVPSSVVRNVSSDQALTLFDVPLMVKTQKMILKNGKLETAPNGKSSKGAEEFSKWFTENYNQIADESLSLPPAESGITKPVPVFKELQRIALITAIAEQLRDRGVALPFWMRGYDIKTFPTPATTPSHTITRNKGNSILTVFGGVNLSPATDKIIIKMSSPIANTIAPKISASVNNRTYLEPVALSVDNKKYNAVVMPGNATKDLGPCVLNETDLLVPVTRNFDIGLTRKFNSFITPLDNLFGRTWSLDLPFLEEQKIPKNNTGDKVEYSLSYNLISPLNSYSEKIEKVYIGDNKLIGFKTSMIPNGDGTNMYFNDKGFIVAYEKSPEMILYNRDQYNRINQIVGFLAEKPLADIKLEYNKEKVIAAIGSNGESVKYIYSAAGDLKQIIHAKGGSVGQMVGTKDIISYEYKNRQVAGVKYNEDLVRQFQYNEKGQLMSSKSSGNPQVEYSISSNEAGSVVTTYATPEIKKEKKSFLAYFKVKKEGGKENPLKKVTGTMQYDKVFRPVKQVDEDGTMIAWDYSGNDSDQMEVTQPAGDKYIIRQSKDGSHVSYSLPDGINFDENYNKAGQLLALSQNSQPVFTQEWNSNGKPEAIRFENSTINHEYDKKVVLQRTLITPPGNSKIFQKWMEYGYNEAGQVASISDFSGMKTAYTYDQMGEVSSINSKQGSIVIRRNKELIDEIETSWGSKTNYTYDPDGNILSVKNSGSENSSFMKFTNGKIIEISGNDGSKYSISYNTEPDGYQIKEIKSPVNYLEYNCNDDGNLVNVLCNSKYEVAYSYNKAGRINQIRINSR